MAKKEELQILNEVGTYSVFEEEMGSEMTQTGTGKYVEVEDDEEDK